MVSVLRTVERQINQPSSLEYYDYSINGNVGMTISLTVPYILKAGLQPADFL